ncbi:hypothetical protein Glove_216g176 [Diversispora epigaea]|uniref:Uncharacterized protein n=1 Tax=Diversispora epigaea TaxID=1348612 RepID=A0A397IQE2_9GLOM|nr:hypothetical protein Glove_216g176 [Diversispora epigaea]
MPSPKYKPQLLAIGNFIPILHYGPFAVNWWTFTNSKTSKNKNSLCIPIRVNERIQIKLNKIKFIIRIICNESNTIQSSYVCENDINDKIYLTTSEAINETYKKIFNMETQFSSPSIMDFDNENIIEQILSGVLFQPFKI